MDAHACAYLSRRGDYHIGEAIVNKCLGNVAVQQPQLFTALSIVILLVILLQIICSQSYYQFSMVCLSIVEKKASMLSILNFLIVLHHFLEPPDKRCR